MFGLGPMELLILTIIAIPFLVIPAVLTLFIPYFIYRIRNEIITLNATVSRILDLLETEKRNRP